MKTLLLIAGLAAFAAAGTLIPTKALLASDRTRSAEVDLAKNGLLAFVRDTGFDVGVRMDLVHLADQERYRISLDPLRDPKASRWVSPDIVLQQLPEGRYAAIHILLGNDQTQSFASDTFEIRKGAILSLGKVRIYPVKDFFGFMKELRIETVGDSALALRKEVTTYGLDTLPLVVHPVHWRKEAP